MDGIDVISFKVGNTSDDLLNALTDLFIKHLYHAEGRNGEVIFTLYPGSDGKFYFYIDENGNLKNLPS